MSKKKKKKSQIISEKKDMENTQLYKAKKIKQENNKQKDMDKTQLYKTKNKKNKKERKKHPKLRLFLKIFLALIILAFLILRRNRCWNCFRYVWR